MNIMVIYGSKSFEHDVSIITGTVINSLLKNNYKVYNVYVNQSQQTFLVKNPSVSIHNRKKVGKKISLVKSGFKTKFNKVKIDCAIIATHGMNGEDGMMKAILDFYNIPSIGSSLVSSAQCIDKYASYCLLKEQKISLLKSVLVTKDNLEHNINYPIIIKPLKLGSSIGINVCKDASDFNELIYESFQYDNKLLIQPFLENIIELNIALYENREGYVLSKVEKIDKVSGIYSYNDKYSKNVYKKHEYIDDLDLVKKVESIALKTYKVLGLSGIVRIDFILKDDKIYLNEVNSIPGSLSYYLFEKKFTTIIEECISKAFFDFQHQSKLVYKSDILNFNYNMEK